jgi:hypothetical protein
MHMRENSSPVAPVGAALPIGAPADRLGMAERDGRRVFQRAQRVHVQVVGRLAETLWRMTQAGRAPMMG